MASYDVIIIGSGPAAMVSAIRCAQLGPENTRLRRKGDATPDSAPPTLLP